MMAFIEWLNDIVWGGAMLVLIGSTGLFLMIGLAFLPLRKLGHAFRQLLKPAVGSGDLHPFNSLMTAMAATVGTGNIAGVATAIVLGGPGALFYMWVIAFIGMATKYAEAVCAVHYRERDTRGHYVGGPMYYIRNGLGPRYPRLAAVLAPVFATCGAVAAFGIGNGVQSNSVAQALDASLAVPPWMSAVLLAIPAGLVLIGGVRRIGAVAGRLVPFIVATYLLACLGVIGVHAGALPAALDLILASALDPRSAVGAGVWAAIRYGVARGVFSNEAGLGSAAIAHAAARTASPVRQGHIAMLGTFIDTIVVCTMTGLAILVSGVYQPGGALTGGALTAASFDTALPGGQLLVSLALTLFAFTTILGWSYYGERCIQFLFGLRAIRAFRLVWVLTIPVGALLQEQLELVWAVADTMNALMAVPNLIALTLLGPTVFALTRHYWSAAPAAMRGDEHGTAG